MGECKWTCISFILWLCYSGKYSNVAMNFQSLPEKWLTSFSEYLNKSCLWFDTLITHTLWHISYAYISGCYLEKLQHGNDNYDDDRFYFALCFQMLAAVINSLLHCIYLLYLFYSINGWPVFNISGTFQALVLNLILWIPVCSRLFIPRILLTLCPRS